MSADRIDHLKGMREEPEPVVDLDASLPVVTPDLIEHLEKLFSLDISTAGYPGTIDHMVSVSHAVTYYGGQRSVIEHLRTLTRGA